MKTITVQNEALLSVGGAYYTSYTLEDKDYNIGEIVKANIKEVRGPKEREYEADLEVTQELIDAINGQREDKKHEEYMQSLKASRSKLYLYALEDAVERGEQFSIYEFLCNELETGDYDIWDEDGELDFDKERETIYRMSEEEIRNLFDGCSGFELFYEELSDELENYNGDKDSEDYQYKKKLLDDYPTIYILTTDSELKTVNGYEYRLLDSF